MTQDKKSNRRDEKPEDPRVEPARRPDIYAATKNESKPKTPQERDLVEARRGRRPD
jgi:hypothetical protein